MNETFKLVFETLALLLVTTSGLLATIFLIIIYCEIRHMRKEEEENGKGM